MQETKGWVELRFGNNSPKRKPKDGQLLSQTPVTSVDRSRNAHVKRTVFETARPFQGQGQNKTACSLNHLYMKPTERCFARGESTRLSLADERPTGALWWFRPFFCGRETKPYPTLLHFGCPCGNLRTTPLCDTNVFPWSFPIAASSRAEGPLELEKRVVVPCSSSCWVAPPPTLVNPKRGSLFPLIYYLLLFWRCRAS